MRADREASSHFNMFQKVIRSTEWVYFAVYWTKCVCISESACSLRNSWTHDRGAYAREERIWDFLCANIVFNVNVSLCGTSTSFERASCLYSAPACVKMISKISGKSRPGNRPVETRFASEIGFSNPDPSRKGRAGLAAQFLTDVWRSNCNSGLCYMIAGIATFREQDTSIVIVFTARKSKRER